MPKTNAQWQRDRSKKRQVAKNKKKKQTELVTTCDYCGKLLGRTCARTDQSGICASGEGIVVVGNGINTKFFCCKKCGKYEVFL